ncbi:hypothetical protein ABBQ38_006964 [Trebouxia sp. C0009 RCD-2024]
MVSPLYDRSEVSQQLLCGGCSEWSSVPSAVLSQIFEAVGTCVRESFCQVCRSWSECPTIWTTCPQNQPFRHHRLSYVAQLTLVQQPFGYQEATNVGQLPALRSLCLAQIGSGSAFSEQASKGYTLPAPCMLTQLTSLSLINIGDTAEDLKGLSLLTNLHSFSWTKYVGELPWASVCGLPCLACLTVAGPNYDRPLPVAGMTGLQVLDVAGKPNEGCWNTLNSLTALSNITQLTCRDGGFVLHDLTPLKSFTALQRLVIVKNRQRYLPHGHAAGIWEGLGVLTWVQKLDIGWIWVEVRDDWSYILLLKVLGAMMQLASLKLSLRITSRIERDAIDVLAEMCSLSSLAFLQELSIVCRLRPYIHVQPWISQLQDTLQAHLTDAQVQVTSLGDAVVVIPVAQIVPH